MKNELISYKTAKLAKEKGFRHMKANCYGDNMCYQLPDGELINSLRANVVLGYILAATQSLLQRWLREKYDFHIIIGSSNQKGYNYCVSLEKGLTGFRSLTFPYDTYEEALEKGLQEALNSIEI